MSRTIAPYGAWASPIDAADTIGKSVAFAEIHVAGPDLYWVEMRPSEGGRQVLVRRRADGVIEDLTPAPANVRTRVHEYGGGAVLVVDGAIYYSELSDQRLYRIIPGGVPEAVTFEPELPGALRYADGRPLPDGRLVYVREHHQAMGEAVNELVFIDPVTGKQNVVVFGADFYSDPRPSPDGSRLLWLEWDHPNMPWDGTRLMEAPIEGDGLGPARLQIAGGDDESVFQPEWAPDGSVVYVSDPTGWWNLFRSDGTGPAPILIDNKEFGLPQWLFGRTSYGFLSAGRIPTVFIYEGAHRLGIIEPGGRLRPLDLDFTYYGSLHTDGDSKAWFVGFSAGRPSAVVELDVDSVSTRAVRSNPDLIPEGYLTTPRLISFPTDEDSADTAHAVYYPPANPSFGGPEGERPPLIVHVHGGPTSQTYPRYDVELAYWTSRGFGMVDVDYRGSTGYGRAYREKLNGEWGVVDVEDCMAAALYLAKKGEVNGNRLLITGGSAPGGYTTLAALAFGDVFSAGASYYGVADLGLLADHTHKFESRYLDRLVGTDRDLMRERSPLYSADRIAVPVILFQGLEDRVVPPEQAEEIARALRENGVPHCLITYEGEDHGFRNAVNIVNSLESELAFYGKVFGFRPAGDLPDIEVNGL